ncbi:MAG TPA: LamG-like jellyroll fold domain-containing protein [Verrucomicrobiae bacterium]|nr:LamG-like jellyroll fold domain-containing protein [Verrucomicrobiae bacterium]
MVLSNSARASIGATTPFVSYEGEEGFLGGGATIYYLTNAPTTEFSSPELEASGHAFVALTSTGQYVQWTNNTGQNITAVNLRSCIPDAPTGGGISNSIDLYVNGVFRQAFSVNSMQNYCYEGTNYDGQTDKNPADGDPRDFWNDTHAFVTGSAIAPGSTLRFQMDSSNTASFYYIDVVDLEDPPAPLTPPANSLSITSYGAISNDPNFDNTSAMNNCFSAARSQGKIAWIPSGTWYISAIRGGLSATGITIAGAGPWYSTIYRLTPANNTQGVANIINAVSCTLSNVLLDCNSWSRDGANNNGAVDFSGTNWVVNNVWIQHTTSSFWCAGVNGIAENCRTLSTWADGGNFNNVQSDNGIGDNLIYSNNFVRGTGDDAMAINSVNYNVYGSTTNYYTTMSNITYVNNTAIEPWGGKCIGIYGGINDVVENNMLQDSARYLGLGVMRFGVNGSDLYSATVAGNVILRCGGNGYNEQQQGMMIGNGGDSQGVGTVENAYIVSNTIVDALYDAVGFSTSTNIVLEYNTIIAPGMNGIVAGPPDLGSGVEGFAALNYNTLTGLNAGYSGFVNDTGDYFTGGIGNSGFTVPGLVPNPWISQDIGTIPIAGGASYDNGVFTLVGSDGDIGGTNDAFHYVYQTANGNYSILAEVDTEEIVNPATKAGLMIRNSLDPADLEASVLVTPGDGIFFQWRGVYGGATSNMFVTNVATPRWIELTRTGNSFAAYFSPNGVNWTNFGTTMSVPMNPNALVGLTVTSHTNSMLCSSMMGNVTIPSQEFAAVHWEGDLIMNLQSSDLSGGGGVWTNRTSDTNSVGNFATVNGDALNGTNLAWNSQTINVLAVNDQLGNAVQSALKAPAEIISNNPVSAEAWIYATAVNQQNSCVIGYGLQGGPSYPEEDREFNYSDPCCGGGVSGDFGSYDTPWGTPPAPGAWHYLAWTYDGSVVRLYLDGQLNADNAPGSPLETPLTVMGVGAGIANSGPNLGADAFQGYIAAARVESGVLTAQDIEANYAMGPLGTAGAITPGGLVAVSGDGQVVLSWDASGNAASYNVKRSGSLNGIYSEIATNVSTLGYTNTGLTDGVTYYYEVSGMNAAGESTNSAPVSAQPVSLAPPLFRVGMSGGQLALVWPQDHTGWSLQEQTNGLDTGMGTNWVTVPGSTLTNQILLPINPANPTAFFRLVYP